MPFWLSRVQMSVYSKLFSNKNGYLHPFLISQELKTRPHWEPVHQSQLNSNFFFVDLFFSHQVFILFYKAPIDDLQVVRRFPVVLILGPRLAFYRKLRTLECIRRKTITPGKKRRYTRWTKREGACWKTGFFGVSYRQYNIQNLFF